MDLSDSSSPNFGTILNSGLSRHQGYYVSDWGYVPGGGNFLWTFGFGPIGCSTGVNPTCTFTYLAKFNMQSRVWTIEKMLGSVGHNVFGAVYGTSDGSLYGSDNASGGIYRIKVVNPGNAVLVSTTGQVTVGNDGAICAGALNPD
ncbi:hypothetical protein RJ55_05597 [Drechmeria coniospora]|nr:hypothetical protein RJ55_05597 [Drechmeria coniospora]